MFQIPMSCTNSGSLYSLGAINLGHEKSIAQRLVTQSGSLLAMILIVLTCIYLVRFFSIRPPPSHLSCSHGTCHLHPRSGATNRNSGTISPSNPRCKRNTRSARRPTRLSLRPMRLLPPQYPRHGSSSRFDCLWRVQVCRVGPAPCTLFTSLLTRTSVILTLFAGLLNLGSTIYALVFVYAFAANALFIVCPVPMT
jgi:hypothetical protein